MPKKIPFKPAETIPVNANPIEDSGNGKRERDFSHLQRVKPEDKEKETPKEPPQISAGPVGDAINLAFNSSRAKLPEFTVIDRLQARLLPQLDVIDLVWQELIEIAAFCQDSEEYERVFQKKRPTPPNLIEEFKISTAQWQKSLGGKNLQSIVDITLAQIETQGQEMEDPLHGNGFEEN